MEIIDKYKFILTLSNDYEKSFKKKKAQLINS